MSSRSFISSLRTPAISRSTISSSISSLRRSPAGERRRAAFLQSDTPGRRHVRDPIQSRLLEGGNAKFLPAPVAAVAASSVVCCWVFFFFFFSPSDPGVLVSRITWRITSRWTDRGLFPCRGPTCKQDQCTRASSRSPRGCPAALAGKRDARENDRRTNPESLRGHSPGAVSLAPARRAERAAGPELQPPLRRAEVGGAGEDQQQQQQQSASLDCRDFD